MNLHTSFNPAATLVPPSLLATGSSMARGIFARVIVEYPSRREAPQKQPPADTPAKTSDNGIKIVKPLTIKPRKQGA